MGSLVLWKFSYAVRRDTASDIGKGDDVMLCNPIFMVALYAIYGVCNYIYSATLYTADVLPPIVQSAVDEALALNQAQNIFLRPRPSSARPFPTLEDRELGTPVLYNFCMPCPSSNHQGFPHVNVVQIPPA